MNLYNNIEPHITSVSSNAFCIDEQIKLDNPNLKKHIPKVSSILTPLSVLYGLHFKETLPKLNEFAEFSEEYLISRNDIIDLGLTNIIDLVSREVDPKELLLTYLRISQGMQTGKLKDERIINRQNTWGKESSKLLGLFNTPDVIKGKFSIENLILRSQEFNEHVNNTGWEGFGSRAFTSKVIKHILSGEIDQHHLVGFSSHMYDRIIYNNYLEWEESDARNLVMNYSLDLLRENGDMKHFIDAANNINLQARTYFKKHINPTEFTLNNALSIYNHREKNRLDIQDTTKDLFFVNDQAYEQLKRSIPKSGLWIMASNEKESRLIANTFTQFYSACTSMENFEELGKYNYGETTLKPSPREIISDNVSDQILLNSILLNSLMVNSPYDLSSVDNSSLSDSSGDGGGD